jgi:glutamate decarboxylase
MMLEGTIMIGYQPLDDKPNFFRVIVNNPASTVNDILFILDEVERLGHDL